MAKKRLQPKILQLWPQVLIQIIQVVKDYELNLVFQPKYLVHDHIFVLILLGALEWSNGPP